MPFVGKWFAIFTVKVFTKLKKKILNERTGKFYLGKRSIKIV